MVIINWYILRTAEKRNWLKYEWHRKCPAKMIGDNNKVITVASSQLKKGDVFVCETGDLIPTDGEIIEAQTYQDIAYGCA